MFVLFRSGKALACHESKKVMLEYKQSLIRDNEEDYDIHDDVYRILKIKKRELKNRVNINDIYLVRYGYTYVPYMYFESLDIMDSQILQDNDFCIDILYRLLEDPELTDKNINHIEKTIKILEKYNQQAREYTPNEDKLKYYKNIVDRYKNL